MVLSCCIAAEGKQELPQLLSKPQTEPGLSGTTGLIALDPI